MTTFEEIREEFKITNEDFIKDLEETLRYTKKTVKRNTIKKAIQYWQAQVLDDKNDSDLATDKFFERYPNWSPK